MKEGGKAMEGLSPRVRGNHGDLIVVIAVGGSIPACAGEPGAFAVQPWTRQVYPRVCGGTQRHLGAAVEGAGLSPRVRGNLGLLGGGGGGRGSIPACAGEPKNK